jgi:hypothetical protein
MLGFSLLGGFCIIMGLVIIKMQLVKAAARYAHVKPEDAKAFTRLVGATLIGIGLAFLGLSIFTLLKLILLGKVSFAIFFIISLAIYIRAQSKYN